MGDQRLPGHVRRLSTAGWQDGRPRGRKKVFLTGLVMFTAASVLCGFAQDQTMLIVSRIIQGVGGAVASSVILAIIVTEFPKRAEQAKAMGMYAFVSAAAARSGCLPAARSRSHLTGTGSSS